MVSGMRGAVEELEHPSPRFAAYDSNCCNQALLQVCAFPSPETLVLSDMAIIMNKREAENR
jgi:hypothetical protein